MYEILVEPRRAHSSYTSQIFAMNDDLAFSYPCLIGITLIKTTYEDQSNYKLGTVVVKVWNILKTSLVYLDMSLIKQIRSEAIKKILNWKDVELAVQTAMLNVAEKRAIQNPRSSTQIPETRNSLLTMPGYINADKCRALACKVVTVFPDNNKHNLPSILANILLFNEKTGTLDAIMDGTEITLWRTAAASVIATKYIRGSHKKNNILAIIGAGAQAKMHAVAFQQKFKFEKVHIWNRTNEKAENLCKELDFNVFGQHVAFKNLAECVEQADVIVTATFATTPLIKYEWLKAGVHINAVGAGGTPMELDEETYKSSVAFVDHLSGVEHELQHLTDRGITFRGEVGAIINGTIPPPLGDEITIFQSLGMATEDCAVAKIVYEKYNQLQSHGLK